MSLLRILLVFILSAACFSSLLAQGDTVNLSKSVSGDSMVEVGDPGNNSYLRKDYELWGTLVKLGSVDHAYKIGKYEVTIQDWQTFLTAAASQADSNGVIDPYGLWNEGMLDWIQPWDDFSQDGKYIRAYNIKNQESLPITQVSLYSVLCYINWKEHGSPILEAGADVDAILKHGAYEFLEDGTIVPNEKSHFYLPSHDEWIKAAYYTSNKLGGWYSLYPTQHDTPPGNNNGDVTNQENYNSRSWLSSPLLALTPVDYFSESKSYYGCYDMGGNVNEWTYTFDGSGSFVVRGGSYESQYNYSGSNDLMINAIPKSYDPSTESATIGFRIAERDFSNEDAASQKNIPADIINRIKEHGVGWTSAEVYDGYVAGKNIYYCSQPKKITKNYPYSTKKEKSTEIDPNESNADRLPNVSRVVEDNRIEITRDTLFERTAIIPIIERHLGRPQSPLEGDPYHKKVVKVETITKQPLLQEISLQGEGPDETPSRACNTQKNARIADHFPECFNEEDLNMLRANYLLPVGALEIPKQLLVGGIAGLAIGAGCEVSGKYLGEGIGYLCGGSRGAAQGELVGENIGAVMGMILPFVIFM